MWAHSQASQWIPEHDRAEWGGEILISTVVAGGPHLRQLERQFSKSPDSAI